MGSRHNRKRTRSRPRNRNRALHGPALSFDSIATPPPMPQPRLAHTSSSGLWSGHWQQPYAAWNDSVWLQRQGNTSTPFSDAATTIASPTLHPAHDVHDKHLRVFGGEPEDGMALCDSMVQVVLDLFDGSVDYEDDEVFG